jgi:hypothetical protein
MALQTSPQDTRLARARKWVALGADFGLSSGRMKWRADGGGIHFLDFSVLRFE